MTRPGPVGPAPMGLRVDPADLFDAGGHMRAIALAAQPLTSGLSRLGDAGALALGPLVTAAALQTWAAAWCMVAAGLQSLAERLGTSMGEAAQAYSTVDAGLATLSGLPAATP